MLISIYINNFYLNGNHIHYSPWHELSVTVKCSAELQAPVTKDVDYC